MDLKQARKLVEELRQQKNGGQCPCCDQVVKNYQRAFNKEMARFLIALARGHEEGAEAVHAGDCGFRGGDYAKVMYWSLAENLPSDMAHKNRSGMWVLTEKGVQFLRGDITIPKYAVMFNRKFLRYDGSDIRFSDVWEQDEGFDFQVLMQAVPTSHNQHSQATTTPTTPPANPEEEEEEEGEEWWWLLEEDDEE